MGSTNHNPMTYRSPRKINSSNCSVPSRHHSSLSENQRNRKSFGDQNPWFRYVSDVSSRFSWFSHGVSHPQPHLFPKGHQGRGHHQQQCSHPLSTWDAPSEPSHLGAAQLEMLELLELGNTWDQQDKVRKAQVKSLQICLWVHENPWNMDLNILEDSSWDRLYWEYCDDFGRWKKVIKQH